jgi:hypothetical protein
MTDNSQNTWVHRLLVTASVMLVLTLIGLVADVMGIAGFLTGKSGPELIGRGPAPTTPPPAAGTTDPPRTTSPTKPAEPTASTTTAPPPEVTATTVYATDLKLLNESLDIDAGAAELAGDHYGHSILYRCSSFCNEPRGEVEVNLGGRFSSFEVTAGVLSDADDGAQQGHFEVFVDGESVREETATLREPAHIKVRLPKGAMRLKLLAYRDDTTENPLQAGANIAGGVSNNLPELAWGNPKLR